ncbi:MAG: hypothetical protein LC793_00485 [Thermomicrobia bacterium]|nr:hypothetical protein [Thermomicrobia bacterium]
MNTFDIALIVAALGVAALTFTQPPITVIADIVALYAASVLAGSLYRPASQFALMRFLPDSGTRTVRIVVFVALLIGGALFLRGLLRRIAGVMAVSRLAAGPLLGNLLSAGLAVVLALGVVLLAVIAVVTVAQIPASVGIVTFAREQTAHSTLLPRLTEPLTIYLRLVGLFFPHGLPEVYNSVAGRTIPA